MMFSDSEIKSTIMGVLTQKHKNAFSKEQIEALMEAITLAIKAYHNSHS